MARKRRSTASAQAARTDAKGAAPAPEPPPAQPGGVLLAAHHDVEEEALHGPIEGHPECPGRVTAMVVRLRSQRELWRALRKVAPRRATDEELKLCHDQEHLRGLAELARLAADGHGPRFVPSHGPVCLGGPCREVVASEKGTDTFVMAGSLNAARFAAGGLLELIDEVMEAERPTCGFALCRPPGHHASRNRSAGFCLVNNVAVAAAYARKRHPQVQRVLIFDWDVHHGQGTQQIFEQSADVLVVNVHRHDGKKFYPATGSATEVGKGQGRGFTVNVALPAGYGDAALWAACVEVLVPAARRFRPDLILVSAGFDAAAGDPLGGCLVQPRSFGALAEELWHLARELCQGRLAFALEGGYNPNVLADCVEAVMGALVASDTASEEELAARPAPFAKVPLWLEGSTSYGAIRRTCEAHKSGPLKLPLPASRAAGRRGVAKANAAAAGSQVGPAVAVAGASSVEERPAGESPVAGAGESAAAGSSASSSPVQVGPAVAVASASVEERPSGESLVVGADESAAAESLASSSPVQAANPASGSAPDGGAGATDDRGGAPDGSASASSGQPAAAARLELRRGEMLVRIAPVQRPRDVKVSREEVWLLHDRESADSPGSKDGGKIEPSVQRWRFQGVLCDNSGALRCAEFRKRKCELLLRFRCGPLLGGEVGLAPIAV